MNIKLQIGTDNIFLRQKSSDIDNIDSDTMYIIEYMINEMDKNNGIGVSGPQVGYNKNILIATKWKKKGNNDVCLGNEVMFNPKIIRKSNTMRKSEEGCISLPGVFGDVMRHKEIKVEYKDIHWKNITKTFSDLTSAIIQHEMDHLNGILFVDKMI